MPLEPADLSEYWNDAVTGNLPLPCRVVGMGEEITIYDDILLKEEKSLKKENWLQVTYHGKAPERVRDADYSVAREAEYGKIRVIGGIYRLSPACLVLQAIRDNKRQWEISFYLCIDQDSGNVVAKPIIPPPSLEYRENEPLDSGAIIAARELASRF